MNPAVEVVTPDSLITLHYRVVTATGDELVSTFNHTPAVLQLGSGELAPPFEQCLIGLPVGARRMFSLASAQAFGVRNAELVRRVARASLPADANLELHGRIELVAPGGQPFSGIVRELDAAAVLIDFNHPLAGQALSFEAEIIGIL